MPKKKGTRKKPANKSTNKGSGRSNVSSRPLSPKGQKVPSGPVSDTRRALEVKSTGPLFFLRKLPIWLVGLFALAFFLLGVLLPYNWAGVFLLLLAAVLVWLQMLSWPAIGTAAKVLRVSVTVVVVAVGLGKIFGAF